MRIAGIEKQSIVDGPGFRYTIFTQGCSHQCPGCHNQATWDPNAGSDISVEQLLVDIDRAYYIDGVTLSGGEPFEQPEEILELTKSLKERGQHIIAYTGYTWEQLLADETKAKILPNLDVVIDGRFLEDQRSLALRFRGSKNQRIIDAKESLKQNKVVLINWEEE